MKAVVLTKKVVDDQKKFVEVKEDFPEPKLMAGTVKVKPYFTRIGSNTKAWSLGQYILPPEVMKQLSPWIPGPSCVGIIDEVASDVYGLKVGQKVFTSSLIESAKTDDQLPNDQSLLGWVPSSSPSPLFNFFKNGCLSEKVLVPVSSVYPLPECKNEEEQVLKFLHVGGFSIAFGALEKGKVKVGDTLLVNGAYGSLGSLAVQLGLVLGCKKVYCVGRSKEKNQKMKTKLEKLFPFATKVLQLKTYEELGAIKDVDAGIDFIGNIEDPKPTQTCIKTIKKGGTYVCAGGSKANLSVNYLDLLIRQIYLCGSFMYQKDVPMKIIRMIDSGLIQLPDPEFVFVEFKEKEVNDAIEKNAMHRELDMVLRVNKI